METEFELVPPGAPPSMQVDAAERSASEADTGSEAAAREAESSGYEYTEAESTESGSGPEFDYFSDEIEEYMTASDSDVPWHIRRRCCSGADDWEVIGSGSDGDEDMSAAEDEDVAMQAVEDAEEGMPAEEDAPDEIATDPEVYDAEVVVEQHAMAVEERSNGGSKAVCISDPDTADEAASAEAAASSSCRQRPRAAPCCCCCSCGQCICASRHDAAALREIRHYQATTHALISGEAFHKLCEDVMKPLKPDCGFTPRAIKALQAASEEYLIRIMQRANTTAINQGRQKVLLQDMQTAHE